MQRTFALICVALFPTFLLAFSPDINRRALAGLWKLSRSLPLAHPIKEFTVYPKKAIKTRRQRKEEFLLMLKEDGSFKQYHEGVKRKSRKMVQRGASGKEQLLSQTASPFSTFENGTWDFVDGNLMLAPDRPTNQSASTYKNDTIVMGKVVAHSQETMTDSEVAIDEEGNDDETVFDTHLQVPKGTVESGKFFYPRHHPSFFEQPMFSPTKLSEKVELRQVLGQLNARTHEKDESVELFRKRDLENRTFLITSHSIDYEPKGRWSVKFNKYIVDPWKKPKVPVNYQIRAMQVKLFSNYTFCTTGGLGGDTILRGKWAVHGDRRDNLWMQVWRFGFGRSVSGSTFSEGKSLTHEDAKTYWGRIRYEGENRDDESVGSVAEGDTNRKLEITGSVMIGWGIEPLPVARFNMREIDAETAALMQEDGDDDEEELEEVRLEALFQQDHEASSQNGDVDWDNAFQ